MDLWQSLRGFVEVELLSAAPESALAQFTSRGIPIFHCGEKDALTVQFRIYRKHLRYLKILCEKRGEKLKVIRHIGLRWALGWLIKRPLMTGGIGLLLAATCLLPQYILFIEVEGNQNVPAKQVLEAADDSGLGFGTRRREVRSEKLKNNLLSALPQLQWAGVNTRGCVAVITVRERVKKESTEQKSAVSSIVAVRDGIILSCTATQGNLLCTEGQAVKRGQLLISGYTDCGISIQATQAEGEVLAQTKHVLQAILPNRNLKRQLPTGTKRLYSLRIGKKRINLWKGSGIWDGSCGRMYEEYCLTLPGGFVLPAALCVQTLSFWDTQPEITGSHDAGIQFDRLSEIILNQEMIAGKILDKHISMVEGDGFYHFRGEYICTEMLGRVKKEEMGEYYGKTD